MAPWSSTHLPAKRRFYVSSSLGEGGRKREVFWVVWIAQQNKNQRKRQTVWKNLSPAEVPGKKSTDFNNFLFYGCMCLCLTAHYFKWQGFNKLYDYCKGWNATFTFYIRVLLWLACIFTLDLHQVIQEEFYIIKKVFLSQYRITGI